MKAPKVISIAIFLLLCALIAFSFSTDKPTAALTVITLSLASVSVMISANATENATEAAEKTREQTERALAQSEKTAWDTHEQTEKALKLTELTIERAEITQQMRDIENSLKNFYYPLRAYPKSPAALKVIHAHAKCSIAR